MSESLKLSLLSLSHKTKFVGTLNLSCKCGFIKAYEKKNVAEGRYILGWFGFGYSLNNGILPEYNDKQKQLLYY